ncbi:MAG: hypothetical protein ACYTBX_18425 [Planctomycetota bacterium]
MGRFPLQGVLRTANAVSYITTKAFFSISIGNPVAHPIKLFAVDERFSVL